MKTLASQIFEATLPRHWPAENQAAYLKRTFEVQSTANGQSDLRNDYSLALRILMVTSGIVLLIACANVATLLLARGVSRETEIAIRVALGSGKGRLVRQLLAESLVVSSLGTILGILFARWGVQLLVGFLDVFLDLAPDARLLGFNAGVATIAGLLVGIVPALRATRVQPQQAMKANSRGRTNSGRGSKFGLSNVLVMTQVSLALLLVVAAGLMISTFWKLASVDPGFEGAHVLLTRIDFRNGNPAREHRVWEMLARLRAMPGVQSASISSATPLCNCNWTNEVVIEGYTAKSPDDSSVFMEEVSDRYFETMGTAIVAGRDFTIFDTPTSQPVAIINQSMARKFFPTTNPLGGYYRTKETSALSDPVEIIGIVKDAKFDDIRKDRAPAVYTARRQDRLVGSYQTFELRATGGEPTALIAGVKSIILEQDRSAALEFTTLSKRVKDSLAREQLLAALSGLFGGLALLLSTIGLYGVMSYNVARRRSEIGIRMALGAEPGRVLRMVMGEVALLIGVGLAGGLGMALATTRIVASFLYGLTPNDPLTLSLAAGVLAGVTSFAGYVQAHRASRLEPLAALREE